MKNLSENEAVPVGCDDLPRSPEFDRSGVPFSIGGCASVPVPQERTVELPGVQLLDRRLGVGQRAQGDARKLERPRQAAALRRAAHVQIRRIGQRDVGPDALARSVLPSVDVQRQSWRSSGPPRQSHDATGRR